MSLSSPELLRSVVSAGAVVATLVPALTIWAGNPARQVGFVSA